MEFSEKMSYCIKNGIKVFPIFVRGLGYIVVECNGKRKKFEKPLPTSLEVTNAMVKTYEYYYEFLKMVKNEKP
jgi:hypothetical protein